MVLSIIIAVVAAPGLLGSQEAIRQSQAKEKREEHRARRCNLIATCVGSSKRSREINGRPIVLKNGKLWIDTGTSDGAPFGHPYAGYYLPYPDVKYEGLVTTITDEAPIMNWIYVDKATYEVKYGVRANAQPNLPGPFDCTRQDRRLTFDGWEGWCAVEEFPTLWALYYDVDDNGLEGKIPYGTRVLEIELSRKEKRWKKETIARQEDQTTKREVEVTHDAPTDKPITSEPTLNPPGVGMDPSAEPTPAPEPFPIPKSIFPENSVPTRPWLPRDQTPPPAYTAQPQTTPAQPTTTSQPSAPTQSKTPAPVTPVNKATTPPNRPPSQPTPPGGEKRTTPKLNRSSGTRAITQAQKFEAMSQKPNDIPLRPGRPTSRPSSIASLDDQRISSSDILQNYMSARPDSLVLTPSAPALTTEPSKKPQPQVRPLLPSAPVSDPAVFGGGSGKNPVGSMPQDQVRSRDFAERPRGKSSLSKAPEGKPPAEPLPPLPGYENRNRRVGGAGAITGRQRQEDSPERRRVTDVDVRRADSLRSRRPTLSRDPALESRRASPEARRLPQTRDQLRSAQGSSRERTVTPASSSSSISRQRERGASISSRDDDTARSSPRVLQRSATGSTSSSTRKPMAATMSSGVMTSMGRRMSPDVPEGPRRELRSERSNSSLYREIDSMMQSGDNSDRNSDRRPALGRSNTVGRRPPERRPTTSGSPSASRSGDMAPPLRPLRRVATAITDMRSEGARDGETERPGSSSGVGFKRRSEDIS